MRGVYRSLGRRARGQSAFTLVELLVVVVIIGILAAVSVPIYLNVRKAAWNSVTEQDVKNAQIAIETASIDMGGKLPTSFERRARSANEPDHVYTMQSFTWGDTSNKKIDGADITLSNDVALCYTADTTLVDKKGRPTTSSGRAVGASTGLTYRIYATNRNNLDVFYLYDSASGQLTKEDNPARIPAATDDSTGGYYAPGDGPLHGRATKPYGVITSCDIETYYHMYGK